MYWEVQKGISLSSSPPTSLVRHLRQSATIQTTRWQRLQRPQRPQPNGSATVQQRGRRRSETAEPSLCPRLRRLAPPQNLREGWPRRGEARTRALRVAASPKPASRASRLARFGSLALLKVRSNDDSAPKMGPKIASALNLQHKLCLCSRPKDWFCTESAAQCCVCLILLSAPCDWSWHC